MMAQRRHRADVLDDILGAAPMPTRQPARAREDIRRNVAAEDLRASEEKEDKKPTKPKDSERRARMNVEIPESLAAEVRDAVIALSGPPVRLTLARFAEEAFRREVARLQAEHHGSKAFPATDRVVRVGRPIGSR
jgi:hypothetical protein